MTDRSIEKTTAHHTQAASGLWAVISLTFFSVATNVLGGSPAAELAISNQYLRDLTFTEFQASESRSLMIDQTSLAALINSDVKVAATTWNIGNTGLGVCIHVKADTFSSIDSSTSAPLRIVVNVDATAQTNSYGNKCLYVSNDGIFAYSPDVSSRTELQVESLDVWAGGLFRRLKARLGRRVAERQMAAMIAQSEIEISSQANGFIADMINQTLEPLLASARKEWDLWMRGMFFNHPYITYKSIFHSTDHALYLAAAGDSERQQLELLPESDEAGQLRMKNEYIEHLFEGYLASVAISDYDVMISIEGQTRPYQSPEDAIGSGEEIIMHFTEKKPVTVSIEKDRINFAFNFSRIEVKGKTIESVSLRVPVDILPTNNAQASIKLPQVLHVVSTNDGTEMPLLSNEFTQRYSQIIPKDPINLTTLLKSYLPWLPMNLKSIDAEERKVTVRLGRGTVEELSAFRAKFLKLDQLSGINARTSAPH